MSLNNVNHQQQLYVLRAGKGFTCLGFDVARDRTIMYGQLMGESLPDPVPYGSPEALELYQRVEQRYMRHPASRSTTFDPHTPNEVRTILEEARSSQTKLRIYYGDRTSGLDWNEAWDILGYIGRSMGPIRVPLLIKNWSSSGGCAILTAHIVKIQATADKRVLWQHPTYHSRPFSIGPAADAGYVDAVYRSGELHAQFRKHGEARQFIDKMLGHRMS